MTGFSETTETLVLIGAGLAALAVIWKWAKKMFKNIMTFVRVGNTLNNIAGEFEKNGGSSLRDAIDRIESDGQETKKIVKNNVKRMERIEKRVHNLDGED